MEEEERFLHCLPLILSAHKWIWVGRLCSSRQEVNGMITQDSIGHNLSVHLARRVPSSQSRRIGVGFMHVTRRDQTIIECSLWEIMPREMNCWGMRVMVFEQYFSREYTLCACKLQTVMHVLGFRRL